MAAVNTPNVADGGETSRKKYDHHFYYGDPKTLDLNKIREDAEEFARGDYYRGPESSIIHFHKYGTAEKPVPCEGHHHEQYDLKGR